MDFVNLPLLAAAALVFFSVLTGLLSARIGFSFRLVVLLEGGLRTAYATLRTGLQPAALLASVGVVLCAGITALVGVCVLGLDWRTAPGCSGRSSVRPLPQPCSRC